jgi:hypothetical protein
MQTMQKGRWESRLLRLSGFVCLAVALLGIVIFIYGSLAPSWYKAMGRPLGFRPTGLALLVAGYVTGMAFFAWSQMIDLLRRVANK